MSTLRLSAERVLDVPADVVYHCLADYVEHHKPGGFLPPTFKDLRVDRGGIGAGTTITFTTVVAGSSRTVTHSVTEPEPGRLLVEAGDGDSTTFTVDLAGPTRCKVRIDSVLHLGGLQGLVGQLLVPRLLRPVYEDELSRLEAHAQAHGPLNSRSGA
jgi:polyketide cyclase/dehydrase/lipid transport protein